MPKLHSLCPFDDSNCEECVGQYCQDEGSNLMMTPVDTEPMSVQEALFESGVDCVTAFKTLETGL